MVIRVWGTSAPVAANAGDAEEKKQETKSKGEVSPSLGRAVLSVLKDVALDDALKTIEQFRSMNRHVEIEFLVPCGHEPGNGFDSPGDAFDSCWKKEIDLSTYGDSMVVLPNPPMFVPLDHWQVEPLHPWQVHFSKISLGGVAAVKLDAAVSNTMFLTDIFINRHQNLFLEFQWDFRFAEGFITSLKGTIGGVHSNPSSYTIEDCSNLMGYAVEALLAKYELDTIVGDEWVAPVTAFDPIPVSLEQLEALWRRGNFVTQGVDFHVEIRNVVLPSAMIKQKCLLL